MPLNDDPAFLRRPLGFAVRVNEADELDVEDARQRLPGLLKFARTFIGEILEKEFATPITGFPVPARAKAAALVANLRRKSPGSEAAQRLVMTVVDICDLEIDRTETSGDQDEEDQDAYREEILDLIQRLLDRFAEWLDRNRFPRLANEADNARREFAVACGKLRS